MSHPQSPEDQLLEREYQLRGRESIARAVGGAAMTMMLAAGIFGASELTHNGIDIVGAFEVGASAVALGIAHICHQAANDLDRQANTYLAERLRQGVIPRSVKGHSPNVRTTF